MTHSMFPIILTFNVVISFIYCNALLIFCRFVGSPLVVVHFFTKCLTFVSVLFHFFIACLTFVVVIFHCFLPLAGCAASLPLPSALTFHDAAEVAFVTYLRRRQCCAFCNGLMKYSATGLVVWLYLVVTAALLSLNRVGVLGHCRVVMNLNTNVFLDFSTCFQSNFRFRHRFKQIESRF